MSKTLKWILLLTLIPIVGAVMLLYADVYNYFRNEYLQAESLGYLALAYIGGGLILLFTRYLQAAKILLISGGLIIGLASAFAFLIATYYVG